MAVPQNKDIAKRLVVETAFLDYCRLAAITDTEIDHLYEQIATLNKLDREEDLDAVLTYDLESVRNKDDLRSRIQEMRSQTAQKIFDYYNLSDENANVVKNMMTGIGIAKDTAQKIAAAIAERTLDTPFDKNKSMADKLFDVLQGKQKSLKEKLVVDYETYKETNLPNAVIQDIEPDIQGHLSGMTREETMSYETRKEDYNFRQKLRDNFKNPDGIRPTFLKLYGTMMKNGMNLAKAPNSASDYDAFYQQMKQMFGDNCQTEIDQALGISAKGNTPEMLDKKRHDVYALRCQEVYFKTMAGILSYKIEFDQRSGNHTTDYQGYIQTIESRFLNGLRNGQTDVNTLAFIQPDNTQALNRREELALRKKYMDETAENQIVSVHHKLPLGAARDVYRTLFGKKDERSELAGCAALVNNLGNMSLIIGKDTHQSLEACGNYVVTANADNMIFAARVNKNALNKTDLKMPDYLKKGIEKYVFPSLSKGLATVNMNFSEAPEIAKMRKNLQIPYKIMNVVDKFKQFWKAAPAKETR